MSSSIWLLVNFLSLCSSSNLNRDLALVASHSNLINRVTPLSSTNGNSTTSDAHLTVASITSNWWLLYPRQDEWRNNTPRANHVVSNTHRVYRLLNKVTDITVNHGLRLSILLHWLLIWLLFEVIQILCSWCQLVWLWYLLITWS